MTTRRDILKGGAGLAAILAAQSAPAILVRSMVAARNGIMSAAKGLSAKSYVQDGLVAMWDGIENAGVGKHSPNTTTWKDLVGNRDLTIGSDTAKAFFKANALHRTPALGDLATDAFISYPCTVSVTMYVDDNIEAGSNPRFLSCTNAGNQSIRREFDCYNSNQANAPRLFNPIRFGRFERASTGLWAISVICSDSTNVKFIDSVCGKYIETTLNEKPAPFLLNVGAWYGSSSAMLGDYYRVAVYSRILTDAEIAANYSVDKARFNIA